MNLSIAIVLPYYFITKFHKGLCGSLFFINENIEENKNLDFFKLIEYLVHIMNSNLICGYIQRRFVYCIYSLALLIKYLTNN